MVWIYKFLKSYKLLVLVNTSIFLKKILCLWCIFHFFYIQTKDIFVLNMQSLPWCCFQCILNFSLVQVLLCQNCKHLKIICQNEVLVVHNYVESTVKLMHVLIYFKFWFMNKISLRFLPIFYLLTSIGENSRTAHSVS